VALQLEVSERRAALDWLRDEAASVFEEEGRLALRDPWGARDDYINVILDRSDVSIERFLKKWSNGPLDSAQVVRTLELLEAQRNAMLMYTSCGWFFSEVSGIETVQILNYAARVIQLTEKVSGRSIEQPFREKLNAATSNIAERGTARQIYDREVVPARLDLRRVAAHYAVVSLFDNFDDDATVYCYRVHRRDFEVVRSGRARMAIASIVVTSLITREEAAFDFAVLHLGETELTGGVRTAATAEEYDRAKKELRETLGPGGVPAAIRLLDQNFGELPVSIRSLFRDEQRRIFNVLCNTTLEEAESACRQLHERYDPLMRFHTRLGIPVPKVLQTAAEFDINLQLRRLLHHDDLPLADIEARLRESSDEHVSLDESTLLQLEQAIARASDEFREHPEDIERLESFETIVSLVRAMDLRVSLRKPQNEYYEMKATIRPVIAASNGNGTDAGRWLALFDSLGEKLSISPEAGA